MVGSDRGIRDRIRGFIEELIEEELAAASDEGGQEGDGALAPRRFGVRRDGQKVLLAVKNMGGESEAAWRALLDDLVARGLKTPG